MPNFLEIKDKKEWEALLSKAPFKTFFHGLSWEVFLENQLKWLRFKHYVWREQALLSLAEVAPHHFLVSHPFCEYGGPLPLTVGIDFEQFKNDLFSQFQQPFRISFHPSLASFFPTSFSSTRRTYLIEGIDQKTEAQLWSSLRKTLRHAIRKAQESGTTIKPLRERKELNEFYRLYLKTCKRNKVPAYPFSFFEYFHSANAAGTQAEIILASLNDKVIAGSVFLFYGGFIHYFLNASDSRYKTVFPNHLILWTQLQKYTGKDIKIFDLGGTRAGSSLEVFKTGWGAKPVPILELKNYPDSPKPRYGLLRQVWGFLPVPVIRFLSPLLLKYKINF